MNWKKEVSKDSINWVHKPKSASYSGHSLVFFLKNPHTCLDEELLLDIGAFIHNEFKKHEIELCNEVNTGFIACGEGLDEIKCNFCGTIFTIEYWHELMDTGYKKNFEDLTFITQCCNTKSSLNDIIYDGKCSFAKTTISITDPDYDEEKAKSIVEIIKNESGLNLDHLWVHI